MALVNVIFYQLETKKEYLLVEKLQIQEGWTVKDFIQNLEKVKKIKFIALEPTKTNKVLNSNPLQKIIKQSKIYVTFTQKSVSIIRLFSQGKQQTIEKQFFLDQKITVEDFEQKLNKQKSLKCEVITSKNKKSIKYIPILQYIQDEKIFIRIPTIIINIYLVGSKEQKPLKIIEIDEGILVSDLIKLLGSQYGLDLYILDRDKVSRAALNHRVSKYVEKGSIYANSLTTKVTAFCQQNKKLPKYTLNVNLNETVEELKSKNKIFDNYHIVDKKGGVAQGLLKLNDVVENKGGSYYFRYKELPDQQVKKARMAQLKQSVQSLQKINDTVKSLAKANSEEANKQMAQKAQQMQRLMDRLTKNVTFIQEKDFNLQEKIRHIEKDQKAQFVDRLYKIADLYTTDMLLEQNPGRIYWPFYRSKPMFRRKRIIDFTKSVIETTNCNQYEERQSTTHQAETIKNIQKSIQQNMNKIEVTAKVGVRTPWVKVSLQSSYSDEKSTMTQKETNTMKSESKQYIVYNAFKMTQAYHIEEENIALKEQLRNNVSKLYDLYEEGNHTLNVAASQFFKNYGTHLQIGKYFFGCRYGFTSMAQCHQVTTRETLATVSRAVKSIGLASQVSGGFGMFSASAGFSVKNTTGTTNSNMTQNEKNSQNFSFEINYKLDGIQVKNRDTWRQIAGVYKKGWRLMGIQDVRLVRIVDILKNQCNAISNPSYHKSYDQFLSELSRIEINLDVNVYEFSGTGKLELNINYKKQLSAFQVNNTIDASITYLNLKLPYHQIFNEEGFKQKLLILLNSKEQRAYFIWANEAQNIIVTKNLYQNLMIGQNIFQVNIQIGEKDKEKEIKIEKGKQEKQKVQEKSK